MEKNLKIYRTHTLTTTNVMILYLKSYAPIITHLHWHIDDPLPHIIYTYHYTSAHAISFCYCSMYPLQAVMYIAQIAIAHSSHSSKSV